MNFHFPNCQFFKKDRVRISYFKVNAKFIHYKVISIKFDSAQI